MGRGGTDPHILKAWYYMEVSGKLHTLASLLVGNVLLLPSEQVLSQLAGNQTLITLLSGLYPIH
jgi:hypothetical protein